MVINVDQLSREVMENIETYADNTLLDVEHAVKLVARETVKELRDTSPVGQTGDYAKSWAFKRSNAKGKDFMDMVVFSRKPNYGKTHLLEDGHEAVDGSFVSPRPHIAAAEKKAEVWLDEQLNRKRR